MHEVEADHATGAVVERLGPWDAAIEEHVGSVGHLFGRDPEDVGRTEVDDRRAGVGEGGEFADDGVD